MELLTRASAAVFSSNYRFLKYLRKWLQLLSSLSGSCQTWKNSQSQNLTVAEPLCKSPLCARGKVFSGRGWCGCSVLSAQDGGEQPAAPLQPPLLGTNDPHPGCRVCTWDLYHLALLHVGSKLKNAKGNTLKTWANFYSSVKEEASRCNDHLRCISL